MTETLPIRRALISVYRKDKLDELAKVLSSLGVEIVSTGGTESQLANWGMKTISVASYTGFPEIFDGRVKTLHPKILGGILAKRDDKKQQEEAQKQKVGMIDMVVVNLYPFEESWERKSTREVMLDNIDIGGPALIRAAAKNFASVAVLTSPDQYEDVIAELNKKKGLSLDTRRKLASQAFAYTAYYDSCIARYYRTLEEKPDFPKHLSFGARRDLPLRYGENPHQEAFLYKEYPLVFPSVVNSIMLSGKELSYNNILDLEAAFNLLTQFEKPFATIIKHNVPCGAACGRNLVEAYRAAYESDPLSAYGGIIGVNQTVDKTTAEVVNQAAFVECILAPGYDHEALEILKEKKNRRIMALGNLAELPDYKEIRILWGGALVQSKDKITEKPENFTVVTKKKPTAEQMNSLMFAWKVCKEVRSNAIVIAQGEKAMGIGAGQTSRVDSVISAINKAGAKAKGAVLASDAFFPMRDGVDQAGKAGIACIIQPGGSKKDEECVSAADEVGMAMVFTGVRHFRH